MKLTSAQTWRLFTVALSIAFVPLDMQAQYWQVIGNSGTTPGVNYLGTSDSEPLVFGVNAVEAMRIWPSTGDVSIGITNQNARLAVGGFIVDPAVAAVQLTPNLVASSLSIGKCLVSAQAGLTPSQNVGGTFYGLAAVPTVTGYLGNFNISQIHGLLGEVDCLTGYSGTINNANAILAGSPVRRGGSAVISNYHGLFVEALTGPTNTWSVYTSGTNQSYFGGNVQVNGTLSKAAGSFRIDHPLDPAHKYLSHSFVESPDMMNVYNGNITTDAHGDAVVSLPSYFEALNRDFRYQLTVIGQFAQAIVAKEEQNNQFAIKTDKPLVKVSWQITGIRHDPYAQAHPITVEDWKSDTEQGFFLHPELYGQPDDASMEWAWSPEAMQEQQSKKQHGQQKSAP
jgi:hypothetical protein